MSRVFQPVGQKRLTNIAVVRLKKNGERFEIACYKNKVGDWRSGVEKDLDEVLQTSTIFHNVGKGVVAKDKELQAAFRTTDQKAICLEILAKGELQVSDKERKMEYEHLFKDVAGVLVEKCINPDTNRPYTLTMLERALRDIHFNLDPKKSAKQQALEALPLLQNEFPIERARMRLKLSVPLEAQQELEQLLEQEAADVESVDMAPSSLAAGGGTGPGVICTVVALVEPGSFRHLHSFIQQTASAATSSASTSSRGAAPRLEVLSLTVMAGDATAEEFANWTAVAGGAGGGGVMVQPGTGAGGMAAPTGRFSEAPPSAAAASSGRATEPVEMTTSTSTATGAGRTTGVTSGDCVAAGGRQTAAAASSNGSGRAGGQQPQQPQQHVVVYPRGPVSEIPEEHASRRERFSELDALQPGWTVELRTKGDTVEAVFFHPSGERVGAYANARRMALQANKAAT